MDLSFASTYTFHKKVDKLRMGPKWHYHTFNIDGDLLDEDGKLLTEEGELWYRDPVECIAELISNPSFNNSIAYHPERVYANKAGTNRIYDEMWTADWWWDIQVSLTVNQLKGYSWYSRGKSNLAV